MVEGVVRVKLCPACFVMAISATRAEFAFVLVSVAIGAIGKRHIAKLLKLLAILHSFLVASNAINRLMCAF